MEFRLLRADEIDCRISTCSQYGVGLLLYKDARCDMNILDETVGPFNWQRDHKELKGNIYCGVSIYDEARGMWVTKWDCGKESYTESEKGEASDSFKRACFNWGIGRELYTAPNMFVFAKDLKTLEGEGKKYTCRDSFKVTKIEYDGRKIAFVEIQNLKTKAYLTFGEPVEESRKTEDVASSYIDEAKKNTLISLAVEKGVVLSKVLSRYGVDSIDKLTVLDWTKAMAALRKS
jgi:hypothetical protein